MKFRYKKYGPDVFRPVIPVELFYRDFSVKYEVLVDSGADFCIFNAEIGEALGIDIKSGEQRMVAGITGINEFYYVHTITLKVGGYPHNIRAGFLPNINRLGYGVVGQKGFFDIFFVKFNYPKREIELKPVGGDVGPGVKV